MPVRSPLDLPDLTSIYTDLPDPLALLRPPPSPRSRPDLPADARAPLSPAGLTPTIFLVGAVFLYQIQFFVLVVVVAWLLAFLYWYCTALTGFRLDYLNLRWLPVLLVSAGVASLIVLLFIAVPRVSTGLDARHCLAPSTAQRFLT